MGKKGSWLSAFKKVLPSKKTKLKEKESSEEKPDEFVSYFEDITASTTPTPLLPSEEHVKVAETEDGKSEHDFSVELATYEAAEEAVAIPQASEAVDAAEDVQVTSRECYFGKTEEEIAAIKIQTAFRAYMARKSLRALRGLVRLKSLIKGHSVKRQATNSLRSMQTIARMQSQIQGRRNRMSVENQAFQRQLELKHEKELEKSGEQWNDSRQSKEQFEANLLNKQEAVLRRQRALAYASSHQKRRKNTSKTANPMSAESSPPQWGWSWLERWMTVRPWDSQSMVNTNDYAASVKSATSYAMSIGEISSAYPLCELNREHKPSGPSHSAQRSRQTLSPHSIRSKVPSHKAPTGSAKVKSHGVTLPHHENVAPHKPAAGSAKKRLSFSASPAEQ